MWERGRVGKVKGRPGKGKEKNNEGVFFLHEHAEEYEIKGGYQLARWPRGKHQLTTSHTTDHKSNIL